MPTKVLESKDVQVQDTSVYDVESGVHQIHFSLELAKSKSALLSKVASFRLLIVST